MPHQLGLFDAPEPPRLSGEVRVARGALAAEAMLLARLEELAAEARGNPVLLARPVRIVVPSRSLRLHVGNAIVHARGRSAAGVTIQTLHRLAFEVLERAGEAVPPGTPLFDAHVPGPPRDISAAAVGDSKLFLGTSGYGVLVKRLE